MPKCRNGRSYNSTISEACRARNPVFMLPNRKPQTEALSHVCMCYTARTAVGRYLNGQQRSSPGRHWPMHGEGDGQSFLARDPANSLARLGIKYEKVASPLNCRLSGGQYCSAFPSQTLKHPLVGTHKYTHARSHTHTYTHALTRTHKHTHTHSLSRTHPISLTHIHQVHTRALTHTHTSTHTHTHSLSLMYTPYLSLTHTPLVCVFFFDPLYILATSGIFFLFQVLRPPHDETCTIPALRSANSEVCRAEDCSCMLHVWGFEFILFIYRCGAEHLCVYEGVLFPSLLLYFF